MNAYGQKYNALFRMLVAGCVILCVRTSSGQITRQTIRLEAGWNAVYLEVQPEPSGCECSRVYEEAGGIIEAIWMWDPPAAVAERIATPIDPSMLKVSKEWHVWFPPPDDSVGRAHPASSFFSLQGGKAYLIKCETTGSWTAEGRPFLPRIRWLRAAHNLAGFHVNGAYVDGQQSVQPTWGSFLSCPSFPTKDANNVYELIGGDGRRVWKPVHGSDPVERGKAYWIYATAGSSFVGPLELSLEQGTGLDFGQIVNELTVTLTNASLDDQKIELRLNPSVNQAEQASWTFALKHPVSGEPNASHTIDRLPPGESRSITVFVDRSQIEQGQTDTALLETVTKQGSRIVVPVSASRGKEEGTRLWVGTAVINEVSRPSEDSRAMLLPTASDFQLRLILLVDKTPGAESVRLLDEAIGLLLPPEDGASGEQRFLVLTDGSMLAGFPGATGNDYVTHGIRITSAGFSIDDPDGMNMRGSFQSHVECDLVVEPGDRLNPFLHRYHPDHGTKTDSGESVHGISRHLTLDFTPHDPFNPVRPPAGWDDRVVGGVYEEVITGLASSKISIRIRGAFRLYRIWPVGE